MPRRLVLSLSLRVIGDGAKCQRSTENPPSVDLRVNGVLGALSEPEWLALSVLTFAPTLGSDTIWKSLLFTRSGGSGSWNRAMMLQIRGGRSRSRIFAQQHSPQTQESWTGGASWGIETNEPHRRDALQSGQAGIGSSNVCSK